jgi:hypothetical protein
MTAINYQGNSNDSPHLFGSRIFNPKAYVRSGIPLATYDEITKYSEEDRCDSKVIS